MNPEIKSIVEKEIRLSQKRMLLSSALAFWGCLLTTLFYPSKLPEVATLFVIGVSFFLGMTCEAFRVEKELGKKRT